MSFKDKYQAAFRDLDLPLSESDGMDVASVELPLALSDYYMVAGRHVINTQYNRLLPPGELFHLDDRLVFMEEDQGVALWSVLPDGSNDPEVWQGPMNVNQQIKNWYSEDLSFSEFIIAMWRWQLTGEEPSR